MKIKMVNKKIGVEKLGKSSKKSDGFLSLPETVDSLGIVRFSFNGSTFPVGTKVYYGSTREEIRMSGKDLQIMNEDNIIAVVGEPDEEDA